MATSQKNLQVEQGAIEFYNTKFDGKGTAGMQDCVETIAFFMPDHPIETTRAGFVEALEHIIASSKAIHIRSMVKLKGMFSQAELSLIIDVMNGTRLSPAMPGETLRGNVPDGIALDRLDEKWEIDGQALVEKITGLGIAEAATLELWANGFWYGNHDELPDMDDYIKKLAQSPAAKLSAIINDIKNANKANAKPISEDQTNEVVLNILRAHGIENDDEDLLIKKFGVAGYEKIREAEAGLY